MVYPAPSVLRRLLRAAERLRSPPLGAPDTPALWLLTDPARGADPLAAAERAPQGAGIIFRCFGDARCYEQTRRAIQSARRRGVVCLVAGDPEFAVSAGADGVHWPERMLSDAARRNRRAGGQLRFVSAAAHSLRACRQAAAAGAHFALLSPVFASASPSAGAPLGPDRFRAIAAASPIPVAALGGIHLGNIQRLQGVGACGMAGVSFQPPVRAGSRTGAQA